ncbi:MAG: hypothetical protein K2P80_01305 [Beijerinckiaceae bacterium]|nr:hypothetical protein [Beijerinckiaceae bacterium]
MVPSWVKRMLLTLAMVFAFSAAAHAQLTTFTKSTLTSGPITFNLGNGVSGTVTFSGTVGSSGLYNAVTSGTNQTSTFILVSPGAVATFSFNSPVRRLDVQSGTGVTGARTDRFVINRTTVVNQVTNVNTSSAALANRTFNPATPITSFSFSSTSANPARIGIRTTSTAQPAPLDPVGATLLGNVVAIGAIAAYRRRRKNRAAFDASPALAA